MIKYPCDCKDMKWVVDHYNKYEFVDGYWVDKWSEIDRDNGVALVNNLGIKFNYCPFCGGKVKGRN